MVIDKLVGQNNHINSEGKKVAPGDHNNESICVTCNGNYKLQVSQFHYGIGPWYLKLY